MIKPALEKRAVEAALTNDWHNAIDLNKEILNAHPQDLQCLNRLARAYLEIGEYDFSKKTYEQVLSIDPYNVIALKNLKRFVHIKDGAKISPLPSPSTLMKVNFIDEPGKTKYVQLIRTASPDVLVLLHCGEQVGMHLKSRGIHIATMTGTYIGRLPDDIAYTLTNFISGGNSYDVFIRQVVNNTVTVFIREIVRATQFATTPTFPIFAGAQLSPVLSEPAIEAVEDVVDEPATE